MHIPFEAKEIHSFSIGYFLSIFLETLTEEG